MATTSTPQENTPESDNRVEYTPPPCAEEPPAGKLFDKDGLEVDEHGNPLAS